MEMVTLLIIGSVQMWREEDAILNNSKYSRLKCDWSTNYRGFPQDSFLFSEDEEIRWVSAGISPVRSLWGGHQVQLVRQRLRSGPGVSAVVGVVIVVVLVLHHGEDLVQVEVVRVADEGAQISVALLSHLRFEPAMRDWRQHLRGLVRWEANHHLNCRY